MFKESPNAQVFIICHVKVLKLVIIVMDGISNYKISVKTQRT